MCDNCYYDVDEIYSANLYICLDCQRDHETLISFRNIVKHYLLNKEDIRKVRHIKQKHILFLIEDIKNICHKKYGGDKDTLQIIDNKINHGNQIKYLEQLQHASKKKLNLTLREYKAINQA